jgi:hypothetical protein
MSRYFSNGTEGFAWQANWCDRCANDHTMHGPDADGPGCPILARSLTLEDGETIPEWLEQWDGTGPFPLGDNVHCIEFRPCTDCGEGGDDDEPRPTPVHPDQGALFDASALAPGVPRGVLIDEGLWHEKVDA